MKENLSDKLGSIFDIKINEDKICTAFRTFEEKIHVLEHQLNQVQRIQ